MRISLLPLLAVLAFGLSSCGSNDVTVLDGSNTSSGGSGVVGGLLNAPGSLVNGLLSAVPVLNTVKIPKIPVGF